MPMKEEYVDLRERAAAMCNTVALLATGGLELPEVTADDEELAESVVLDYAEDPQKASKELPEVFNTATPSAMLLVHETLEQFGQHVAKDAERIRNLVVNQLVLDSQHADPKVRLKACELLGKTGDVNLFVERKHVTLEHKSGDEIRGQLRDKLTRLKDVAEAEYTVVEEEG